MPPGAGPEQTLLLPPSLRDWLPEDHLAYFISDAVEAMDLSRFEERYGDYKPRSGKKGKLFKRPMGEPDPKDTVSAIPKTFETEGVAQTVTWQSRTLVIGLLGSIVPLQG